MFLAAAWGVLVLDVLLAHREAATPRPGPAGASPSRGVRLIAAAMLVAAFIALERRTTVLEPAPLLAVVGLALVTAGLALHFRARSALGRSWSSAVTVRPGGPLVTHGPYARVRHPLYLAILLVAAGTALAHPSPATFCLAGGLAVGLGLKLRQEDRALRKAFGTQWTDYATAVPALGLPRRWSRHRRSTPARPRAGGGARAKRL